MADHRTTSMCHVGMNREAVKEAVKSRLVTGQQYQLKSGREHIEDKRSNNFVCCKLEYFSRNAAVFEHKDGTKEAFTYQELWQMLLTGEFK